MVDFRGSLAVEDHLRSILGIICGLGIIYGWGSFAVLYSSSTSICVRRFSPSALSFFRFHLSPFPQKRLILRLTVFLVDHETNETILRQFPRCFPLLLREKLFENICKAMLQAANAYKRREFWRETHTPP